MFSRLFEILWGPEPVILVQRLFGEHLAWLFHGLTLLGASPGMVIILALAFWLRGHRLALRLSGILLLTVTTNMLLWQVVGVPRPDDPGIVQRATVSVTSFPSGHTGSATAMWGLLASLHYVPTLLSILVVLAVMVSRLYLGVHYLGDVAGGLVVGLVALAIYRRWHYFILHWLIGVVRSVQRLLGNWTFPIALAVGPIGFLIALLVLGTNQKGWQIGGAILGAGLALALEERVLGYRPVYTTRRRQVFKVVIGLAGLAVLAISQFLVNETPAEAILFALAPLWMVLIAPWIFTQMDSEHSKTVSHTL